MTLAMFDAIFGTIRMEPIARATYVTQSPSPMPKHLEAELAELAEQQRQWEETQRLREAERQRQQKASAAKFKAAVSACTAEVQQRHIVDGFDAYVDAEWNIRAFGTDRAFFAFNKCMSGRGYSTSLRIDRK
jgi:hypothetical protein